MGQRGEFLSVYGRLHRKPSYFRLVFVEDNQGRSGGGVLTALSCLEF